MLGRNQIPALGLALLIASAATCSEDIPPEDRFPEVWKKPGNGPVIETGEPASAELSLSEKRSCLLKASGALNCWGERLIEDPDAFSELSHPGQWQVQVEGGLTGHALANASDVALHCGVRSDREVVCWIDYGPWDLDLTLPGGPAITTAPVVIPGAGPATQIVVTSDVGCALDPSGIVRCWGDNSEGAVGTGTTANPEAPAVVAGLNDVVKIAANWTFNGSTVCALRAKGAIACWGGSAGYWRTGGDYDDPELTTATDVPGLPAMRDVSVGGWGACGVARDGSLWCWGDPMSVGSGPGAHVVATEPALNVVTGDDFICVLGVDRKVRCGGENGNGQLGNGSRRSSSLLVAVRRPWSGDALQDMSAIGVGDRHVCALSNKGKLSCWGDNEYGQAQGAPPWGCSNSFTELGDLAGVATEGAAACIWDKTGKVRCWGDSTHSPIAAIGGTSIDTPTSLPLPFKVVHMSLSDDQACAVGDDGLVRCWQGPDSIVSAALPSVSGALEVHAGAGWFGQFACARTATGEVWCWGNNDNGQLGDGSTTPSVVPVKTQLPGKATALACGTACCAVLEDGRVACWGDNSENLVELETDVWSISTPVLLPEDDLKGIVAVSMSSSAACAIAENGTLSCWGSGLGYFGIESLAAHGKFTSVSVGNDHACGLRHDPSGKTTALVPACWGSNNYGQLGMDWLSDPGALAEVASPTLPAAIEYESDAIELSAGDGVTCARFGSAVTCWGNGGMGLCGWGAASDVLEATEIELK